MDFTMLMKFWVIDIFNTYDRGALSSVFSALIVLLWPKHAEQMLRYVTRHGRIWGNEINPLSVGYASMGGMLVTTWTAS